MLMLAIVGAWHVLSDQLTRNYPSCTSSFFWGQSLAMPKSSTSKACEANSGCCNTKLIRSSASLTFSNSGNSLLAQYIFIRTVNFQAYTMRRNLPKTFSVLKFWTNLPVNNTSVCKYWKILFYPSNTDTGSFYGVSTDIDTDAQYPKCSTDILVFPVFYSISILCFKPLIDSCYLRLLAL